MMLQSQCAGFSACVLKGVWHGLKSHIEGKYDKAAGKLKTPGGQVKKKQEAKSHLQHIDKNKEHYDNLLKMHNHLQQAKHVLINVLNQHEGGLEHHIRDKRTNPEGFVVNHAGEPTKLVNRAEFSKANLLKNNPEKTEE